MLSAGMSLGTGRCTEHPLRPGIGICVECRRVVCAECSTPVEGINRCARCLASRLQPALVQADFQPLGPVAWGAAALAVGILYVLALALTGLVAALVR